MGSTEAVSKIKWLFQAEKAGHAGTLDPLASGMLMGSVRCGDSLLRHRRRQGHLVAAR